MTSTESNSKGVIQLLPNADVQNFNILLNMSDHVLAYCSWSLGARELRKKFQHSTHSGNSGTGHAHFFDHSFNRQNNKNYIIYHDVTI